MGYFDGLTDAIFKKDASDNTLFYPWGVLGAGFVIESEEKKDQIRGFIKKLYIVMLPLIVLIQVFVGFWLNLVLLPFFYAWYFYMVKKLTKELIKSQEKLKVSESYKNSASSHNLLMLILLELASVGFVGIGFFMLLSEKSSLAAWLSIGFFGLGSVAIGYMILVKLKGKKQQS